MKIKVLDNILKANNKIADANRELFIKNGNFVINLMSAPGSGKTTLIEQTHKSLDSALKIGVVEGDIETSRDAERLDRLGIPVIQLNTGHECHLDANMVSTALPHIDLAAIDILFIENVGNLVCPAEFIIGEDAKVMILSVTEGDEKPLKYPLMFHESKVCLINKIDLIEHTNFNLEEAKSNAKSVSPHINLMPVSATTGKGFDVWVDWLKSSFEKEIKSRKEN